MSGTNCRAILNSEAGPEGWSTMYRDIQVSRVQDAQERPWMYGIISPGAPN